MLGIVLGAGEMEMANKDLTTLQENRHIHN